MQLFPYQVEGAAFLARVKRGLLADEMGLGKSAQAIAAADEVCGPSVGTIHVVCPASLVENWKREIKRFAHPERPRRWRVVSYDKAARGGEAGFYENEHCDVLILDEAHYLKNHKAKRTKAIFGPKCDGDGGLVSRAAHVFCLTGTPTPNNPSELWPMLRAVMPDSIRRDTGKPFAFWPFIERYCVTQDTGFGIKIVRGKNLSELKERIAPFILRRKKEEVLKDLPPIRFDTLALEGKLPANFDGRVGILDEARVADVLQKDGVEGLRTIAPHVAQLRRVTGLAKVAAAADWVADFLEGSDRKLVCFAHHRDVIAGLTSALDGHAFVTLTGDDTAEERQEAVDAFQSGDARLFIGQIQAAGTGLTLTAASDALFVESSWTPADNQQAAMRIHRIGQRNACLVRFAMLAGSIDEDIQRAVMRKTTDIAKLFS